MVLHHRGKRRNFLVSRMSHSCSQRVQLFTWNSVTLPISRYEGAAEDCWRCAGQVSMN
jgi:hypothetical protein